MEYLNLFPDTKNKVLVMFSGGVDSRLLLHFCIEKYGKENVEALYVFHGDKGSLPIEFMKNTSFGVKFHSYEFVNSGSETNWRKERYDSLKEYLSNNKYDYVFFGHHRDDQIENMFISLFKNRKNNIFIPKSRLFEDSIIFRPFLELRKNQIIKIANDIGLTYIDDPTNDDMFNIRNVVRNGLLAPIAELKDSDQYMNSFERFVNNHFKMEKSISKIFTLFEETSEGIYRVPSIAIDDEYIIKGFISHLLYKRYSEPPSESFLNHAFKVYMERAETCKRINIKDSFFLFRKNYIYFYKEK